MSETAAVVMSIEYSGVFQVAVHPGRRREARQGVDEQRVEAEAPVLHRGDDLAPPLRRGSREVALERPEHFHVPPEPRPLGIVLRAVRKIERNVEVPPVFFLDLGLEVGVADVGVGVGDEPDLERPGRLRDEAFDRGRVAVHPIDHSPPCLPAGDRDDEDVAADCERRVREGPSALGDPHAPAGHEVVDADAQRNGPPAGRFQDGRLGADAGREAEGVGEDHHPFRRVRVPGLDPEDGRVARLE
jgi:hypothetical protein